MNIEKISNIYSIEYKNKWNRIMNLSVIPCDITEESISNIFEIMLKTGYTFLTSYYMSKQGKNVNIVDIDTIRLGKITPPAEKKVEFKKRAMQKGIIEPIIVNDKFKLEDGLITYQIFKEYGEKYIPYIKSKDVKFKRNKHWRNILWELEDGKCYICGRKTILDIKYDTHDLFATIDHVIPRSNDGVNTLDNCRLCCRYCNRMKSNRELTEELKNEILESIRNGKVSDGKKKKRENKKRSFFRRKRQSNEKKIKEEKR